MAGAGSKGMRGNGRRSWWATAAAVSVGALDVVAAWSAPPAALPLSLALVPARPALPRLSRDSTVRTSGALHLGMEGGGKASGKDWSARAERDLAMGFLTADAPTAAPTAAQIAKAARLAQRAREAMEAADEAEERAKSVRAQLGTVSKDGSDAPKKSNGLSGMLSPVAMQMAAGQAEYLGRCPIRQMQEDLTEIRCGVMNIVGKLGLQNLLALGFVLYAISVVQISN